MRNVLFVGITRALGWVHMSATAVGTLPLLARFDDLARRGRLTIHRSMPIGTTLFEVDPGGTTTRVPPRTTAADDPLDIL
jgi:hypothetical protein